MQISVLYSTQTGTSQMIADVVSQLLEEADSDLKVDVSFILSTTTDVLEHKDLVIFVIPTYDEGEIEYGARFFFDEVDKLLKEEKLKPTADFAILAPGDSSYEHYATAGDLIKEFLESIGINEAIPMKKIDSYTFDIEKHNLEISEWVKTLILRIGSTDKALASHV